jgi:hypothetical protein
MAITNTRRAGRGWTVFAAIVLMVAGAMQFFDGLWAIRTQDTAVDALFWNNNLEAWGWFYLIVGVALFVTGVFILQRAPWAYGVGIAVGCIGAVVNMFWIFSYPLASVVLIALNMLVVYGLTTYGVDDL